MEEGKGDGQAVEKDDLSGRHSEYASDRHGRLRKRSV
jgi:hypothetical protein